MVEWSHTEQEESYWSERYKDGTTGWDIGEISSPIKAYIDQVDNTSLKILIPGAGNAYEAEYLFRKGFKNVFVLDLASQPLQNLQERIPEFPAQQLLQENFFEHQGTYDLILEQTFFCSFVPTVERRTRYAKKMADLLPTGGILAGLWFNFPKTDDHVKRPFGGSKEEYLTYFNPYFEVKVFEPCYNSIAPRAGRELFGIFVRK